MVRTSIIIIIIIIIILSNDLTILDNLIYF